jgi:hypothetical protein
MMDDIIWRLAGSILYLLVAGCGLCGGAFLWLSLTDPVAAYNAICAIFVAASAEYTRLTYFQA